MLKTTAGPSALLLIAALAMPARGGQLPPPPQAAAVQKIGESQYRIGTLRVDTAKGELRAPATINDVMTLEFAVNTKGGLKAYETAITVDSNAVTFNAALLLLGLDPSHGRPTKFQFDPAAADGDPVSVEVEYGDKRVPIEEVIFDQRSKKTLPRGTWVYTGSTFWDYGLGRQFVAEVDGVIVGMMHGPAAIIDRADLVEGYGNFIVNPNIGIKPGQAVTLIVTAIKKPR